MRILESFYPYINTKIHQLNKVNDNARFVFFYSPIILIFPCEVFLKCLVIYFGRITFQENRMRGADLIKCHE